LQVPSKFIRLIAVALAIGAACFNGCDRDDGINVYVAPKDPPVVQHKSVAKTEPIEWTLPPGWTRLPSAGQSAFGSFAKIQVLPDDPTLTLNVNLIQNDDVAANVNRWEGQLGLPPTPAAELGAKVKTIQVEAHPAHRVDLSGTDPDSKTPTRLLAVILPQGDGSAFSFLLKGPADKVAPLEPAFDAFIASVKFPGHDHGDAVDDDSHGDAVAADTKQYALKGFTVPPGWVKDETPRDMRLATLFVGEGSDRAELIVSKFPFNRFGTMLENVNRWRSEVGLPASENELNENAGKLVSGDLIGVVFDFAGPQKRSYVAMFRKGADMWFVKLIGPAKTVEAQRGNYDAFLKSLQFGEAG
jgi:hypothetical protein